MKNKIKGLLLILSIFFLFGCADGDTFKTRTRTVCYENEDGTYTCDEIEDNSPDSDWQYDNVRNW